MSLLKDKKGMIVGATSGIGRAAATLFAKEGAEVVVIIAVPNYLRASFLKSKKPEVKHITLSQTLLRVMTSNA
ncbi:hypothetical protein [Pseudoalteromonas xiamenensis]